MFVARALHEHRRWADRLRAVDGSDDPLVERFVHEVRRCYPFFPAQAARAVASFEWEGVRFEPGTLAVLDLYGTDHQPALWPDPDRFDPTASPTASRGRSTSCPRAGATTRPATGAPASGPRST